MGTPTLISAAEYLHTSYENPEPDFVSGKIVRRAMPNNFHSEAVDALIAAFVIRAPKSLFRRPELRLRVASERYRVADLAVFDQRPVEAVPERVPLVVIEVLSPDDSYADLMSRFADYAAIGVRHLWLVDPVSRGFSVYRDRSLLASSRLELTEHSIVIELSDIFPA